MDETRCRRCRAPMIAGQCSNLGCFERPPLEEHLGPSTSADLLELDAVPEEFDDAPTDVHARTLARARR